MADGKNIDSVVIHMYTMGTGDCFVLKFMKGDEVSFKMLIDCGVWRGKFADIRKFVETLKKDVENHVDVLIVTHEHKDHVFGFQAAEALFTDGKFKAEQIWMGWPENDEDDKVKKWQKEYGQKKMALGLAADELRNVVQSDEYRKQFSGAARENNSFGMRANFSGVLDEYADLHVNQAAASPKEYVGNMKGMKVVKEDIEAAEAPRFFFPGDIVENQKGLEGVKIFVLGPPKLYEEVKTESGGAGESFPHNRDIDEDDLLVNALNGIDPDGSAEIEDPFDESYVSNDDYHRKEYDAEDAAWRRIDFDWLFSSGQFALRMNSLTNNLSLALAFEFEDNGKVMLFPGDAEFGSWSSWQDIDWAAKGEKAHGTDDDLTTENLLNRTVFYKVAHHLSHNGTAKKVGLDMMTSKDLVAMATLDYNVISDGWKSTMPNQLIVKDLLEKTHGRTIIMNEDGLLYDRKKKVPVSKKVKEARAAMPPDEKKAFEEALNEDSEHFIEYHLKL